MAFKGRRGRPLVYGHSFGNEQAIRAVEELAAALREVPSIGERIAAKAMPELLEANENTIQQGCDAYGEPWRLTQDGRVPLKRAAGALRFSVRGSTIVVMLEGVEVAHHIGFARGYRGGTLMRRPIIPERSARGGSRAKGLPSEWVDIIRRITEEELGLA